MVPSHVPFVDLHAQYESIRREIDGAFGAVIAESSFIRGRFVERFEREFAQFLGVRHCISCGNGTDAIYIALRALGLERGDEVITTAHSWISTSETITQAGGQVVFVDTDGTGFTIDPASIEAKVTSRTKGLIVVHLYGQSADLDPILAIAARHNLWVIEDCAQAHGATYRGRKVGTFGAMATFSFYPSKNLGAMGDAGCLVTNDDGLASFAASFARHGGKGAHVMEGINSRMDGLQGAVLSAKLPHLPEWNAARRRLAAQYDRLLEGLGDIEVPRRAPEREHVYHLYVVRTGCRDALRAFLANRGIETVINYPCALPFLPAYARLRHSPEDFPHAHADQSRILSLPMYPEMTGQAV
ncbi:MAG: DegT/DnrJ/EryC1/StrS family aminotransferase, partial [Bacteroidales bacterium]